MTERIPAKRISRACLRCRQHKAKCNLNQIGSIASPPCERCIRAGQDCILGGSNRGGRRHKKLVVPESSTAPSLSLSADIRTAETQLQLDQHQSTRFDETTALGAESQTRPAPSIGNHDPVLATSIEDTFAAADLHNTSDALNFLSQVAENAVPLNDHGSTINKDYSFPQPHEALPTGAASIVNGGLQEYKLVMSGSVTVEQVMQLVVRYKTFYHPYFPIIPKDSLEQELINDTARNEPHNLTAILLIATKDLPGGQRIFQACSEYMDELIAEVASGKRRDIQCIEALLVLAEWEPQSASSDAKTVGCGEEDIAAWMHIGLALRLSSFLKLDSSFNREDDKKNQTNNRRQLIWAACYLCDRQISVRVGRPFESHGIPPAVVLSRSSFPSLLPQVAGETDHSSVIQARLELTQIFTNVHDVLYAGMGGSMRMMLKGNYAKYIDDFRASAKAWQSIWGTLTCSPQVKLLLQLSYEYLRLYTSAYAFQATTARSITFNDDPQLETSYQNLIGPLGSLPEARFVYESVDAAKSLLTMVNNFIPSDIYLCHFPMRFSLYCVNSAVFLYKAWCLGILTKEERTGVRQMIGDVAERLRRGSIKSTDLGERYARLLRLLWSRTDPNILTAQLPVQNHANGNNTTTQESLQGPQDEFSGFTNGFSWLDLQAVSEMLLGEGLPDMGNGIDEMQQFVEASRRGSNEWTGMGWPLDEEINRLF